MSAESFAFDVATHSRADGFNAVAHSAYISGQKLFDQREYTTQKLGSAERVMHTEISIPKDSPRWIKDVASSENRELLWNMAEGAERRKDAQVCRRLIISIDDQFIQRFDREASVEKQAELVREFVSENFTAKGMVADWAIHWDKDLKNPHAHVILTRREATEEGFSKWKDGQKEPSSRKETPQRPWNDRKNCEAWRESWANIQNRELEARGVNYRIDHRSYERRGLEIEARQKHFGNPRLQAENEQITDRQAEQLIKNPRPLFDCISDSYVAAFSIHDLERYAESFGGSHKEELFEKLKASNELVKAGDGKFLTQGMIEKQAQRQIEPVLSNFESIQSWKEFDDKLEGCGWRLDSVERRGKVVHDLVNIEEPEKRISAFRLDKELGPKSMAEKFGQDRRSYEIDRDVTPPKNEKEPPPKKEEAAPEHGPEGQGADVSKKPDVELLLRSTEGESHLSSKFEDKKLERSIRYSNSTSKGISVDTTKVLIPVRAKVNLGKLEKEKARVEEPKQPIQVKPKVIFDTSIKGKKPLDSNSSYSHRSDDNSSPERKKSQVNFMSKNPYVAGLQNQINTLEKEAMEADKRGDLKTRDELKQERIEKLSELQKQPDYHLEGLRQDRDRAYELGAKSEHYVEYLKNEEQKLSAEKDEARSSGNNDEALLKHNQREAVRDELYSQPSYKEDDYTTPPKYQAIKDQIEAEGGSNKDYVDQLKHEDRELLSEMGEHIANGDDELANDIQVKREALKKELERQAAYQMEKQHENEHEDEY